MTNHEEKYRKIVEHNKKIVIDHYHLDYDKFLHQHIQEIGKYFRSITVKFTDKEMEDATVLGYAIADKTEPEDGISYKEIAIGLGIYDNVKTLKDVPAGYKEKIDRLLYVLQYMALEFEYNTTPEKGVNVGVNLVPVVKRTKKIRHSDGKIKKI